MNRKILPMFTLFLILSLNVYQFANASYVHVMKFEGDFSIVYQNTNPIVYELVNTEPSFFVPTVIIDSFIIYQSYLLLDSHTLLSKILLYLHSPRAPPNI